MIGLPMGEEIAEPAPAAEPIQRLKFLMRSGNYFTVDGVIEFEMRKNGLGQFTHLTLKQVEDPTSAYVFVPSIDLSQIEAIVRLPASGPGRRANEKGRAGEH